MDEARPELSKKKRKERVNVVNYVYMNSNDCIMVEVELLYNKGIIQFECVMTCSAFLLIVREQLTY